jgi:monoamine oxidase
LLEHGRAPYYVGGAPARGGSRGGPIGSLHFAGTETGRAFWGNIESALQSGQRAAREILGR